jgi:hypothetical protein
MPVYGHFKVKFLPPIALMAAVIASGIADATETGRIKRKPPDAAEAERIASETAMNDSLLQKGDIVVTDRGFFVFRGVAPDGYTFEFAPVPNPLPFAKPGR